MSDYTNAASSLVATTAITPTAVSVVVTTGEGAKFPTSFPFPGIFGNADGDFERVRVTYGNADTFTLAPRTNGKAWPVGAKFALDGADYWGVGAISNLVNGVTGPRILHGNTAQAIGASAGTVATAGLSVSVLSVAADAGTAILAAGTVDGQVVIVVNTSASHTVTFDAASTSKIADGAGGIIAALTAQAYVWNAVAGRWFHLV